MHCWPRVILLGDFLTPHSFDGTGWGGYVANLVKRKCDVINRGFSGYTTEFIMKMLDNLIDGNLVTKTGFPNHFLLEDSKFGCAKLIGSGLTTEKYPLVIATPFFIPMMLNKPGTGENISGEIYEVDEKMMEKLDELEANGRLYDRTSLTIKMADETVTSGTYIINDFLDSLLTLPFLNTYSDATGYVSGRESTRSAVDVAKLVKK